MTVEEQAIKIQKELAPDEGWWKISMDDAVYTSAHILLKSGMFTYDEVKDFIEAIISATREEYGE